MSTLPATLIVIAKEPRPGFSKTRLTPPCTPEQAASIAAASLRDTLEAALACAAERHVLALDGNTPSWVDSQFEVIPQAEGGLDLRLAQAFEDVDGPSLLIGMDTPQVTPELLESSLQTLLQSGTDAVLGLADDGGYWAVGLNESRRDYFEGVPMSSEDTGSAQLQRLLDHGLNVATLPPLVDVDTFDDALAVAKLVPQSRFAVELSAVDSELTV